jgi:hypothetical protein
MTRTKSEMDELSALSPFFIIHPTGETLTCRACKKPVKLPTSKLTKADLIKLSMGLLKNHRKCLASMAKAANNTGKVR